MLTRRIALVSFNGNERAAVEALFDDLAGAFSPWRRDGPDAIERDYGPSVIWRLEHVPLLAQGNVVAAARLAEFFQDQESSPEVVVFYGCAGAVHAAHSGCAFIVRRVNYLSLGTVAQDSANREEITLKNKWLCHLDPSGDVQPLDVVTFPLGSTGGSPDWCTRSGIPPARVAATDKVVRIRPGRKPSYVDSGPPHQTYHKAEWSYGEALAFVNQGTLPLIVEMESYGIGLIARALKIDDRVIVLRVTTDVLEDHTDSDSRQRDLLLIGRHVLALLLLTVLAP